jgi:hypothetical protein
MLEVPPTPSGVGLPLPPARPRSHSPYPAFKPPPSAERRMSEPQPEIEIVAPTMSMNHDAPPPSPHVSINPRVAATMIGADPPPSSPRVASLQNETTSLGSVLVVRKKTSRATYIVLGLVFLLLAATVAAYFLRARFLS